MSLGCDWLRTGPTSDAQVSPAQQASAPSRDRHIQEAEYCFPKSTGISPGPTWNRTPPLHACRRGSARVLTSSSAPVLTSGSARVLPGFLPRSCRAAQAPWGRLRCRTPGPSSSAPLRTAAPLTLVKTPTWEQVPAAPPTFLEVGVDLLLLVGAPAGQLGGGDEERQQSRKEAEVGHGQHEPHQESWRRPRGGLIVSPSGEKGRWSKRELNINI